MKLTMLALVLTVCGCHGAKLTAFCEPAYTAPMTHRDSRSGDAAVKCGLKGELTILEARQ